MMEPSLISAAALGSFITTVLLLQFDQRAAYPPLLWIALTVLICAGFVIRKRGILLIAVSIGVAAALLSVMRIADDGNAFASRLGSAELEGWINDIPSGDSFLFEADGGRILVQQRGAVKGLAYGDRLRISGMLEALPDEGYGRYLRSQGVSAILKADAAEKTGNAGSRVTAALYGIRGDFEAQIRRIFPEPQAALLAGILLGSRSEIPERIADAFRRTGITHILAISGTNITIVLSVITGFLFWLPLRWRTVPAVVAIALFTVLTGATASVVRAAVMGILGLLALHLGRERDIRLAILWTMAIMTAWNPQALWYDAGFQLSFLAVIGLVECTPLLERWTSWIPKTLGLREALQATLAAQLLAMPLIVTLFGEFSVISPLANILVAPAVPLSMLLGFVATVVSFVAEPLGLGVAFLGNGVLQWIIGVAETLAAVPGASVAVGAVSPWIVLSYYLVLISGIRASGVGRGKGAQA